MRFYKTLNQYKASNLVYDVDTETAYSYEWYVLAERMRGVMILNNYSYSPTTQRHYYKIRKLFDELNIEYILISAPNGLQDLTAAKNYYTARIADLQQKINNPRTKQATNALRQQQINECNDKLKIIDQLSHTIKSIKDIVKNLDEVTN